MPQRLEAKVDVGKGYGQIAALREHLNGCNLKVPRLLPSGNRQTALQHPPCRKLCFAAASSTEAFTMSRRN
jgi:hypothetical protein